MSDQVSSVSAYKQTEQVRENQAQDPNIDALILTGPEYLNQIKPIVDNQQSDEAALRPVDSFEKAVTPMNGAAPAPNALPPAGQVVPVDPSEFAFAVDGRGPAVALQENLRELLSNDKDKFAAIAQALGVSDLPGFQDLVENATSVDMFKQLDSDRITLVNQNRQEVSADQLPQLINAQMVIKPGFEVPSESGLKDNPVEADHHPIRQVLEQLQTPVVIDPAEVQRRKAIDPAAQTQQDASAAVV